MSDLYFDGRPIQIIGCDHKLYPERVKVIMGRHAPEHLYMVGNTDLLNMAGVGFCGSRKPSPEGWEAAQDCAEQAAHNDVSVISGNAAGIDLESHYKCLKAGGKTILILPEGINHFKIRKALEPVWDWERVLVVSQFKRNERWVGFRAMERNKLIIALSRVMIVIEAGEKSGTFNAGEETLKRGLPLYVIEYPDMFVNAPGNQMLLKGKGAFGLTRSKPTNRFNLEELLRSVQEDKLMENHRQHRQQELLN